MPNQAAWNDIAVEMADCHIPRSAAQIRAWWKTEKADFHRERALQKEQGGPRDASPETYQQARQLWHCAGHPACREKWYAGR